MSNTLLNWTRLKNARYNFRNEWTMNNVWKRIGNNRKLLHKRQLSFFKFRKKICLLFFILSFIVMCNSQKHFAWIYYVIQNTYRLNLKTLDTFIFVHFSITIYLSVNIKEVNEKSWCMQLPDKLLYYAIIMRSVNVWGVKTSFIRSLVMNFLMYRKLFFVVCANISINRCCNWDTIKCIF